MRWGDRQPEVPGVELIGIDHRPHRSESFRSGGGVKYPISLCVIGCRIGFTGRERQIRRGVERVFVGPGLHCRFRLQTLVVCRPLVITPGPVAKGKYPAGGAVVDVDFHRWQIIINNYYVAACTERFNLIEL